MKRPDGFTLIEMLIVVVVIGILAAIAIPKFSGSKEKAILATMKADLRNLLTAEEAYFTDNQAYTATLPANIFDVSAGVTGPNITVTGRDIQAWVGHTSTTKSCAIFIGTTPLSPASKEGEAKCA